MRKQLLAFLVVATTVAGCQSVRDSRVNPFNWFGRSTNQVVVAEPTESAVNPLIPTRRGFFAGRPEAAYEGSLVQEVTDLRVLRVPGGAVIEVTGVMASLGAYDVRLVPDENDEASVLSYSFRAIQSPAAAGVGSNHVRTVTAAVRLTEQQLTGITAVRVVAAGNVRTARR